jgi:hypothetical protein
MVPNEVEVPQHRMLAERYFPGYLRIEPGSTSQLAIGHRARAIHCHDTLQAFEKVPLPGMAAELSIRHGAKTKLLLFPDNAQNLGVFDLPKLLGADFPASMLRPRLSKLFRPQQTAHVIRSKRRLSVH